MTIQSKPLCPFCVHPLTCEKLSCVGCYIREASEAKENEQIGEHIKEYWKSQRSGAE